MIILEIKTIFIRNRNNKYIVVLEYVGTDNKTHTKNIKTCSSKKEANQVLYETKAKYKELEYNESHLTLSSWCSKFVDEYMQGYTHNTKLAYKSAINRDIAPYFRDAKLTDLRAIDIQDFYNHLTNKYTTATANTKWQKLSMILKNAYRLELIPIDLSSKVITIKDKEYKERKIYSKSDINRMFTILEEDFNHLLLPVALSVYAGLRISEVQALTWDDVDLINSTITIKGQALTIEGKIVNNVPKYSSYGIIPISEPLRAILENVNNSKDKTYREVALNSLGRPYRWQNLSHVFSTFCERYNFPNYNFHSLRHYAITQLAESGASINVIKAFARHKSLSSTSRYLHADISSMREYIQ